MRRSEEDVVRLNLSDFGLLGDLRFSSRLLPVDLVSADPTSELVSQPENQQRREHMWRKHSTETKCVNVCPSVHFDI